MPLKSKLILVCAACVAMPTVFAHGRTIEWSGYNWGVRDSDGQIENPGPGVFSDSSDNVWVDEQGVLHLKIRHDGTSWTYSEVFLDHSLGYGRYEWEVATRYDLFADNVVGGLFTYLAPQDVAAITDGAVGNGLPDTPHEIDIEFTRGFGGRGDIYYTTHDPDVASPSTDFLSDLNGDYTTHRFTWAPQSIEWESYHGHVAGIDDPPYPMYDAETGQIVSSTYQGEVIPQDLGERVHINLWALEEGFAVGPIDGKEYELLVSGFVYTPLASIPEPSAVVVLMLGVTGLLGRGSRREESRP